jgi:hypothetical protein
MNIAPAQMRIRHMFETTISQRRRSHRMAWQTKHLVRRHAKARPSGEQDNRCRISDAEFHFKMFLRV